MRKYYIAVIPVFYYLHVLETQMGVVKVNLLREAQAIYTVK
jgi:hypothetical protein